MPAETTDRRLVVERIDERSFSGLWRQPGQRPQRVLFPTTVVDADDLPVLRPGDELAWSFGRRPGDERLTVRRPSPAQGSEQAAA